MFPFTTNPPRITPSLRLSGSLGGVMRTDGPHFATRSVDAIELGFDGIAGDRHAGYVRRSGGREPWYPRGTRMRNERQLSLVALDELAAIAAAMDIPRLEPGWIGANLVIEGLATLSMIPPRTRLFFENGVTLSIEAQNIPCRIAGRVIGAHYPDRSGLDLLFPKVARRLRGLVASVECPGRLEVGMPFEARLPEQWIYARP